MSQRTVTLDVREDIRTGCAPFSKILNAVGQLGPDENLLLIAPFEPQPLFGVLAKQGFAHEARETGSGDWEVLFTRRGEVEVQASAGSTGRTLHEPATPVKPSTLNSQPSTCVEVDARGLEPPQPMVTILEALTSLPAGAVLRARTDRR